MSKKDFFSGPFESESIAAQALPELSGNFRDDLELFVKRCFSLPENTDYKRLKMGMQPEPYMYDYKDSKPTLEELYERINQYLGNAWESWQWLYQKLNDVKSQHLLLNVIAYRTIGWRFVSLPLDNHNFWQMMSYLKEKEKKETSRSIHTGFHDFRLTPLDLNEFGYPVNVFSDAFGVFNEFIYSQYQFKDGNHEPDQGDCVIDCGACFGGTSLYFAHLVGTKGKVLSFEFMPDNIKIFNKNLELNPKLKSIVELIESPVFSTARSIMTIEGSGPATQVHSIGSGWREYLKVALSWIESKIKKTSINFVKSTTIDNEVKKRKIKKVGLIKMDIEGSEYSALIGAKNTISTFKPILAICVYHRLIDFYEVPQFIDSLNLGYKFYLQHSTVHGDETVIFGLPPS